ncbi:hypothetical protein Hanom_Chr08g00743411 [Helianthus anomalus]
MICRPYLGDHYINSWMVERVWGVGLRIEGGIFTKHSTRRALEQLLSSSKGPAERIEALKHLAHKAVAPSGTSTQNFKSLVEVVISGSA